jgi:hypothetical protein
VKVRVPIVGTPGKTAQLDADATVGAIFGANLVWPDGTLVTPQQIAAMVAELNGAGAAGELASTIWRLVREVPENVEAVASLESAGIVRRSSDGAWTAAALSSNDLPDLPDAGGGTLQKFARDAYGRVAGTSVVVASDIRDASRLQLIATSSISALRMVVAENGAGRYPSTAASADAARVVGLAVTAAAAGDSFDVVTKGEWTDSAWAWAPGIVFCGDGGALTQAPASGWILEVGRAMSATRLVIDVKTPFLRS